jgi:RNA polymerase sigma-70 factor (ECF subfamily)
MSVGLEIDPAAAAAEKAIHGDAAARERLFQDVFPRVLRYHHKLTAGDAALAEELAQETMVRVIRSFDRLRQPDRFLPWVFRIATHVWRDHHRSRAPRESGAAPAAGPAAAPAERRELTDRVLRELARLPEVYRVALTLRFLEGMEYEDMALVLEVSAVTLRSHVARGRQMIRRQLEGDVDR